MLGSIKEGKKEAKILSFVVSSGSSWSSNKFHVLTQASSLAGSPPPHFNKFIHNHRHLFCYKINFQNFLFVDVLPFWLPREKECSEILLLQVPKIWINTIWTIVGQYFKCASFRFFSTQGPRKSHKFDFGKMFSTSMISLGLVLIFLNVIFHM